MNWTGGSLQRSKNANKGIVQRQKAHFARVRTQLQTGHNASTFPSRPESLRDEKSSSGGMPLLDCHTVRRSKHCQPLGKRNSARDSSDPTLRTRRTDLKSQSHRGCLASAPAFARATSGHSAGKTEVEDAQSEDGLLEARRRKLLLQQDWAGLKRSEPVTLQFPSRKEKDLIGKRRKLHRDHRRTITESNQRSLPLLRHTYQGGQHGAYTTPIPDVSIRIGTDALTNPTSTQHSSTPLQPAGLLHEELSDTLLFAADHLHTVPKRELQSTWVGHHDLHTFVGVQLHVRATPPEMWGEGTHINRLTQQNDAASSASEQSVPADTARTTLDKRRPVNDSPTGVSDPRNDDDGSGCYISQHTANVVRPLQVVMDRTSKLSATIDKAIMPRIEAIGETSHVYGPANASLHKDGNVRDQPGTSNALVDFRIADDGPWRSFLTIPDDSSTASKASAIVQPHSHALHRTLGHKDVHTSQSGLPHAKLYSGSSILLPTIASYSESKAHVKGSYDEGRRVVTRSKASKDADRCLWEAIVFGSDDAAESTTADYEAAAARGTHTGCSRLLSSTAAVRSLSSSPFEAVSGSGSRISESVRDAGARAPQSTFPESTRPMISSLGAPPDRDLARRISGGGESDEAQHPAGHSGIGEDSMTHTSLQSNVSKQSPSMTSNSARVRASRTGMSWPKRCNKDPLGGMQAASSETAYIHDIPSSDSDNLDLVDAWKC